jgi:hypothetical protein
MKITHINEVLDLEDGQPIIAITGTVKYAGDLEHGVGKSTGKPWNKQFFVLAQNGSEVAATMWDAEGNEMKKGETVLIENTQNKKGQWSGMVKGSYTNKKRELCHTLEIRANQVKIKPVIESEPHEPSDYGLDGDPSEYGDGAPESPARLPSAPPARPNGEDGVMEAKKHLMQTSNLMFLSMEAARWTFMKYQDTHKVDLSDEHFQALCASLFIEASGRRSTDGITWWSYTDRMPSVPLK